ncbi:MAG: hypothetical protein J7L96_04215 [Bacteroidales bacterium]|nr:hypothetical protein [Bacteroidales bacterium]
MPPDKHPRLSQKDFKLISEFIISQFGINISPNKYHLLEYRLASRLKKLGLPSYEEYTKYLFSQEGQEVEPILLIDAVSTNKTDFYREAEHFNVLLTHILPEIHAQHDAKTMLHIWSAGCSSGEEVYTLALTLEKYKKQNTSFEYSVYGTDISGEVLETAFRAIYPMSKTTTISKKELSEFFLYKKEAGGDKVRIKKLLRDKVSFAKLNLMDEFYNTPNIYPIIFCRNTLIYFDAETREKVVNRLINRISNNGYLFISHTESLLNSIPQLKLVYPSVYQKIMS